MFNLFDVPTKDIISEAYPFAYPKKPDPPVLPIVIELFVDDIDVTEEGDSCI